MHRTSCRERDGAGRTSAGSSFGGHAGACGPPILRSSASAPVRCDGRRTALVSEFRYAFPVVEACDDGSRQSVLRDSGKDWRFGCLGDFLQFFPRKMRFTATYIRSKLPLVCSSKQSTPLQHGVPTALSSGCCRHSNPGRHVRDLPTSSNEPMLWSTPSRPDEGLPLSRT